MDQGEEEPERQTTPFLVLQFFIFPMAIVAVCVAVFVIFGLVAGESKGPKDLPVDLHAVDHQRDTEHHRARTLCVARAVSLSVHQARCQIHRDGHRLNRRRGQHEAAGAHAHQGEIAAQV